MKYINIAIQVLVLISLAPLVSGFIRVVKNNIRMRKGAPILQPYYNLSKLMKKDEVVSEHTSFIFRLTPYIVFASSLTGLFLLPVLFSGGKPGAGIFLLIIFLMALARFFTVLAGLDAGSSFGGMGSSREMFISGLIEPTAVLCVLVSVLSKDAGYSLLLAGGAFLFVVIAETSRIPVDNQETHLELTMVHEAMILEYSGRSLALIEYGSYIKQIVLFALLADVFFSFGIKAGGVVSAGLFLAKIAVISCVIAILEVSIAKMRLFKIVNYVLLAFLLAFAALVAAF